MKKTYYTRYTSYGIYVNKADKLELIRFERQLVPNAIIGSTFVTDDEELQKALEEHRDYGLEFRTDDKEEVVDVKEEVQEEPKRVKRYKNKD
jgi:hypothetical protein